MSTSREIASNRQARANIAIAYDHPLDVGGVETHLLSLFKFSQEQRLHFTIFAPVTEGFRKLAERFDVETVRWEDWSVFKPVIPFQLKRLFDQYDIDIVNAHSPTAGVAARLAARLAGIPAMVTVHLPVYLYHGRKTSWRANLGRALYTRIDQILNYLLTDKLMYVSKSVMDECLSRKLSPARISSFIPNGVDVDIIDRLPKREQLRDKYGARVDDCILVFVGRLEDQKGADLLPALILPLQEELPELKLWVIGDGPLRYTIESQLDNLVHNKRAIFWGHQQDVEAFLKASDICIMPSRYEALPFVLLEALAVGLPCIVTDTGDNRLLVEHEMNGYVAPVEGVEKMREAIRNLACNEALRAQLGKKSREKAMQFRKEIFVQRIFQEYLALISRTDFE